MAIRHTESLSQGNRGQSITSLGDARILRSHVRRGFYDQAKTGTAPVASEALRRIAALYDIDARVRGKSAAERLAAG